MTQVWIKERWKSVLRQGGTSCVHTLQGLIHRHTTEKLRTTLDLKHAFTQERRLHAWQKCIFRNSQFKLHVELIIWKTFCQLFFMYYLKTFFQTPNALCGYMLNIINKTLITYFILKFLYLLLHIYHPLKTLKSKPLYRLMLWFFMSVLGIW